MFPYWPKGRVRQLPDPATVDARLILLASEGRAISPGAAKLAGDIARRTGANVHVFSVARIWGTALGFPHPGLMPNKREWQQQHDLVADAVERLKKRDVVATGRVVSTRAAAKRIVQEAGARNCDVIVMGADPPRKWFLSGLTWADEPHRVRARAAIPVYLVTNSAPVE
jgi:nucleotide-binding universal stress UspA family protein